MKQLVETLENSRNYTLKVAEAMPEESYGYRPIDTVWSFGELMNHISYGIEWWRQNYIKGNDLPWNPPFSKLKKSEILNLIQESYDKLKDSISGKEFSPELFKGVHATLDHITHHRGQAVLYLRCKGQVPPEYTF